jgi:hypothetical protein
VVRSRWFGPLEGSRESPRTITALHDCSAARLEALALSFSASARVYVWHARMPIFATLGRPPGCWPCFCSMENNETVQSEKSTSAGRTHDHDVARGRSIPS